MTDKPWTACATNVRHEPSGSRKVEQRTVFWCDARKLFCHAHLTARQGVCDRFFEPRCIESKPYDGEGRNMRSRKSWSQHHPNEFFFSGPNLCSWRCKTKSIINIMYEDFWGGWNQKKGDTGNQPPPPQERIHQPFEKWSHAVSKPKKKRERKKERRGNPPPPQKKTNTWKQTSFWLLISVLPTPSKIFICVLFYFNFSTWNWFSVFGFCFFLGVFGPLPVPPRFPNFSPATTTTTTS